jgi:glycosyltransferase involved in cell wall biosynthesis
LSILKPQDGQSRIQEYKAPGPEALRVAIDARILPGLVGGVAQAVMGLIHALGQLNDGSESYILVVDSQEQLDWLKPFAGRNQRIEVKPRSRKERLHTLAARALTHFPSAKEFAQNLARLGSGRVHEVPASGGFYEGLGCHVVHFPHQRFIRCGLPTIYNPHDLQHLHFPQFFPPSDFDGRETVYRGGCEFADTVVVASRWVKDDLIRQYGVNPGKVQVIPWGPPTQAYPEPSQQHTSVVKRKYSLEQPFALYPAVTWPHKNHIRLLEAIAHLREGRNLIVRLVCTGSLYEPEWVRIRKRLGELELEHQVKFLGFVPDVDLRAIYRLSQFLVMPTLFESDSFPIYEAWLEGVPVICSNVTSLPDQVTDAALLFNPNDSESIENTISKVATDPETRQELRRRGYRRLKDFDWERTAKAYRAVYRRVAGHPLSDEDRQLLSWDWMLKPQRNEEMQP